VPIELVRQRDHRSYDGHGDSHNDDDHDDCHDNDNDKDHDEHNVSPQQYLYAAQVWQVQHTCQDMQHLQQQLLAVRWGVLHQIHQSCGVGPYASCQTCKLVSHRFWDPYSASTLAIC